MAASWTISGSALSRSRAARREGAPRGDRRGHALAALALSAGFPTDLCLRGGRAVVGIDRVAGPVLQPQPILVCDRRRAALGRPSRAGPRQRRPPGPSAESGSAGVGGALAPARLERRMSWQSAAPGCRGASPSIQSTSSGRTSRAIRRAAASGAPGRGLMSAADVSTSSLGRQDDRDVCARTDARIRHPAGPSRRTRYRLRSPARRAHRGPESSRRCNRRSFGPQASSGSNGRRTDTLRRGRGSRDRIEALRGHRHSVGHARRGGAHPGDADVGAPAPAGQVRATARAGSAVRRPGTARCAR